MFAMHTKLEWLVHHTLSLVHTCDTPNDDIDYWPVWGLLRLTPTMEPKLNLFSSMQKKLTQN